MKLKFIAAAALSLIMGVSTVYGAEKQAEEKRVITYEEAVELAVKNNSSLATLNESLDLMEKNNELLVQQFESTIVSLGQLGQGTMNNATGTILTNAKTLESNIKNSKLNKEIATTGSEYLVKNYFSGIKQAEAGIELLEDKYYLTLESYNQSLLKNKLGIISDNDLQTAKNNVEKDKSTLEQTKLTLEKTYESLGNALGLSQGTDFEIEYNVDYAPMEMTRSLESYISTSISNSPSLEILENKEDLAATVKNISVFSPEPYSYLQNEYSYNSASRSYGDAVDNMKVSIAATYNDVMKYELERESLEAALVDAQTTYNTALTNYNLGNVTELTLKQAELGLKSAENDLLTNTYNHDMKVFEFENPSVIQSAQ